jgi:hypothetical protein
MNEQRWMWGAMILIILAGVVVFGMGVGWGLWSPGVDQFLRSDGGSLGSGAQIDHLAGDWLTYPNAASDVETHPIGDRSKPVTLVENARGVSEEELIASGDRDVASARKKADAAEEAVGRAISQGDEDVLNPARVKANEAEKILREKVSAAEDRRVPGFTARLKEDAVNRARIVRRYRLYSFQPDEMITFRALASMHPGALKLDPKLYQYGGLWIYPVGALLEAAGSLGLAEVNGDREFYLDKPEAFGRFYIVARGYSAAWGIVGGLVVFALVRRAVGGIVLPLVGALCFLSMPVVVDLGHEAKPHLAGTVLLLIAILAGMKYVESGKRNWFVGTAALCGAAAGMVLSGVVGLVVLPIILMLRPGAWGKRVGRLVLGVAIATGVYFATNPYLAIHLMFADQRGVLSNNLANTQAMYSRGPILAGAAQALRLIAAGMSFPMMFLGVGGCLGWMLSRSALAEDRNRAQRVLGWLLAALGILVAVQFALFAGGKPGEYGRFGLFVDVALMMAAAVSLGRFARREAWRGVVGLILLGCTLCGSIAYERGFLVDATSDNSRMKTAAVLQNLLEDRSARGTPTLYVPSEPAPYCLPPVDLYRWRVVLLPKGVEEPVGEEILVAPEEEVRPLDLTSSPISWAGKGFRIGFSSP